MKFINKIEDTLIEFCRKHSLEILFGLTIVISLIIKQKFLYYESDDYKEFLSNWMETIRQNGGLLTLKNSIGNYNAPYLIIMAILSYLPIDDLIAIKIVSIIFDYIISVVVMLIIYELFKNDKKKHIYALIGFVITSLLPTVVLNSSAWAQCDSIYTAFGLLSILYFIKEKNIKAFIFLGVAFSFKLQAIFLLPIFIFVYLSKKNFSLLHFLIIPITNIVMCLPAIVVGKPIGDCFLVYLEQTKQYSRYISMNFPSVYSIFMNTNGGSNLISIKLQGLDTFGMYFTIFCFICAAFFFINKKIKLNNKLIIKISLLSIMFATFMLPRMHDRYLYMADVISIIYLIIEPKKFYIPLGINFVSAYTYIEYLAGTHSIPIYLVAILFAVLIYFMAKDTVNDIKDSGVKNEKTV